jgi:NAD(P)-dependent dehydrogenase (short-subunit alcohol dehydrogenase family)
MVQGLAVEAAPGVRVNAVAPTFVDPFWCGLSREQFDGIRAGFVPRVPLRRLTGQVLAVDGGVSLT